MIPKVIVKKIFVENKDAYTFVYVPRPQTNLVTILGSIEAGSIYNPKGRFETTDMLVAMFDEGTKKLTKDELHKKLESMGATISFSINPHRIQFKAQCLPKYLKGVLSLIYEQIAEPGLRSADLSKLKKQLISSIMQAEDDTRAQAQNIFRQELFPKNHPHTEASLKKQVTEVNLTTVGDLKRHHKKVVGGNDIKIVIVGSSIKKDASELVRGVFSKWKSKDIKSRNVNISATPSSKTLFKTIRDKTTTDVFIGTSTDLNTNSPELFPFLLGLEIFGSGAGLTTRLMATVREKEGLTYSVRAIFAGAHMDLSGFWMVYSTFAPKLVERGLASIFRQLRLLTEKGISKAEFEMIQKKHIGRYLISTDTTLGLASRILYNLEMGFEADYINKYLIKLKTVTRRDINKAVTKYMGNVPITIVGAGSVTPTGKPL